MRKLIVKVSLVFNDGKPYILVRYRLRGVLGFLFTRETEKFTSLAELEAARSRIGEGVYLKVCTYGRELNEATGLLQDLERAFWDTPGMKSEYAYRYEIAQQGYFAEQV